MTTGVKQKEESPAFKPADSIHKAARQSGSIGDDPQLPKRELAFYLVALISIIVYAGYGFYQTYGRDPAEKIPLYRLKKGWISEYKDIGEDNVMESGAKNFHRLIVASVSYLAVSKITLVFAPMAVHHIACALYTLLMVLLVVESMAAASLLIIYAAGLCISYFSYVAVWVLVCGLLILNNSDVSRSVFFRPFFGGSIYDGYFGTLGAEVFSGIFGYLLCRVVSLSHSLHRDLTVSRDRGDPVPTLWQHVWSNLPATFHYTFYLPNMWCGPITTYDAFKKQLDARARVVAVDKATAVLVAWRSCRLVVWFCVLELLHHYLPVLSYLHGIDEDEYIVYKHLVFSMFLQGQNFMLTYVQLYGWPAILARLDGIELPHWPDCISHVYSYSIMWRVFDRGLCAIMQAHIYLPLGGSRRGPWRQLLAVCISFAFICLFHGDTSYVRAWVILNVAQMLLEKLVATFYCKCLRNTVTTYLSPQNEKRLVGYVISWNMMVSCGIIFLFLASENGFIVLPAILLLGPDSWNTPLWHLLTMQFAVYCAVQIGRFYEARMSKRCPFQAVKRHQN